jgi:hypothetical protein
MTLVGQPTHSMVQVETAGLTKMIRTKIAEDLAPIRIMEVQVAVPNPLDPQVPHKLPSLKRMAQTKVFRP